MLLYNGRLLPDTDFALPLPNRGLFFNDGFFETLVWADGGLRYRELHAARMQRAATALNLDLPPTLSSAESLENTLVALLPVDGNPTRLRIQLWRGGAGLYTPETNASEWLATARPFTPQNAPVATAGFAETVRMQLSSVSFCKGPQALTYVLAARERQRRGLDELLLLSTVGHVAEAVAAAVFWLRNGELFTPSLATGCVAGVRRAHLLAAARQRGLSVQEVLAEPAELLAAEAVFTANVAGIRAVRQVEEQVFDVKHPLLEQLRRWDAQG
ncbi:aminotransferase class IV [Hymenobacter weizhouensis]|uniref:aminotransferase class IV n=1 Tax=Hymenobacter sp. YIM 151500-1 TaxID=2987689 RepID=UPI002226A1A4|nr:aminotransferase class IV [Hymenobacter sp. YIM 151500-1]UYZ64011.1 aminotransferase class IV [Hymenobacter sp. YIM 151500-1]